MKCILHIGVHKTGSTSIQKALHGYDDGRVSYGALGEPNHSVAFGTLFRPDHLQERWNKLGCSVSERVALYNEQLGATLGRDRETVIFSGESISLLDTDSIRRMRQRLERSCDDIRIVMFVRDPLTWTASMVQELVKHGGSDLESVQFPSFEERFNNFSSVFHQDAIEIVKYEDALERKGDVVTPFCDLSGADPEKLSPTGRFAITPAPIVGKGHRHQRAVGSKRRRRNGANAGSPEDRRPGDAPMPTPMAGGFPTEQPVRPVS